MNLLTEIKFAIKICEHLSQNARVLSDGHVTGFTRSLYLFAGDVRDRDLAASKHLRKLCDCGLLLKRGNGPATYYEPTELALRNWLPKPEIVSPDARRKSTELESKSTELEGKPTELSTELQQRVQGVGRKSDKSSLLQLVVDILRERPQSAAELAYRLDRTQKHIRMEYLQPLLEQGRITRSNPEKPTDPNQVYSANPTDSGIS